MIRDEELDCPPSCSFAFSPGYWKWQHRFLLDTMAQFGLPSLFLTQSPHKWTFPFPAWFEDVRDRTGHGPTELNGLETVYIAHVLKQIVYGYQCSSNCTRWLKHVLNYDDLSMPCNILTYFYRIKF